MTIKTDYPNVIIDQSLRDLIASKNIQNNLIALENKLYVPCISFITAEGWNGDMWPVNEWRLNRTTLDCLTGYILVQYAENEYLAVGLGRAFDPDIEYWIEYLDGRIQIVETPIL
jgi:hypothetical protein